MMHSSSEKLISSDSEQGGGPDNITDIRYSLFFSNQAARIMQECDTHVYFFPNPPHNSAIAMCCLQLPRGAAG